MNKDLTLDLPLTDEPIVDVSSLNVGLKVGKHAKKQYVWNLKLNTLNDNTGVSGNGGKLQ